MENTKKIGYRLDLLTRIVFSLAATYNIGWLFFFRSNPSLFQSYYTFPISDYPLIFSLLKVIVLTFGLSYIYAAFKPNKLWLLASISFIAKSLGIVLAFLLVQTQLAYPSFYWQVLFNDIVWLPALGVISYQYFKAWQDTSTEETSSFPAILKSYQSQYGNSLDTLQNTKPVMLIFLRHFGCTFCKEALGDLAQQRTSLEKEYGLTMVFVHMADENYAREYFSNYRLQDAHRISDPTCTLYQAFSLERASFQQVFGVKSWLRGLYAFIGKGHGIGKLVGDGFRMPGVFLIHQNQIHQSFRHQTASDVPPYQQLASCPVV